MNERTIDWKSGEVQTTGAVTVTVCSSDVIPDSTSVMVDCSLEGRSAVSGEMASSRFCFQAKRVAGVLTMTGAQVDIVTFASGSDAALAGCTATVDSNTNQLRLRVTGVAANTIDWFGDMRVRIN